MLSADALRPRDAGLIPAGIAGLVPAHQQKGSPGGIEGIEHPVRSALVIWLSFDPWMPEL
jgi:hypothetical protein